MARQPRALGFIPGEKGIFTRGDTVGALRNTADVTAFLGTVDSLEEARLLLATRNQPLVCTTDPAKSGWRKNDDGSFDLLIAGYSCGTFIKYRIRYHVAKDGTVTTVARDPSLTNAICGRRPEGLVHALVAGGAREGLAAHFVEAAYLEAASVIAFRRPELELRRFGAPASLVQRARRARAEEIDHARGDEASHAELARDVARWVERKLTPAERDELAQARADALATLAESLAHEPSADVVRVAGIPTSSEARALLDGLARFQLVGDLRSPPVPLTRCAREPSPWRIGAARRPACAAHAASLISPAASDLATSPAEAPSLAPRRREIGAVSGAVRRRRIFAGPVASWGGSREA